MQAFWLLKYDSHDDVLDMGGVLEPVQAAPVMIKDNCFIGLHAIIVECAHVYRESVIGSNVVITGPAHIIDATGEEPVEYRSYSCARSVVIPDTYTRKFAAGEYIYKYI